MKIKDVEKAWRDAMARGAEAFRQFLSEGYDPEENVGNGIPAWVMAIARTAIGQPGNCYPPVIFEALLDHGLSASAVGKGGNTALHHAAWAGRVPIVRMLVTAGADGSAVNSEKETPLHVAMDLLPGRGNVIEEDIAEIPGLLVRAGTDPMAYDQAGRLALHRLADLQMMGVAYRRRVMDLYDDMESPTKTGWPPLAYAAQGAIDGLGHLQALLLIRARADMEVRASGFPVLNVYNDQHELEPYHEDTPLHIAIRHRRNLTADVLLRSGASLESRNGDGLTPIEYAWKSGCMPGWSGIFDGSGDNALKAIEAWIDG